MEEKKYLRWYNKVGYGSGDISGNIFYSVVSGFVLIYLTDTVGLDSGIIGVLMLAAKIFDGVSDVFFGTLIDKTHTKMGKARPWVLWSELGNIAMLIFLFSVPPMGKILQYVYFFIVYTLLNAVFFTANNIAYSVLTSLVTKNKDERVQMGSIRFIFSMASSIFISYATVALVPVFGGGAAGWRNVAIMYAVIALICNTICVFSVKELPQSELEDEVESENKKSEISFFESMKILVHNKYFLLCACIYIFDFMSYAPGAVAIYYMTYILKDPNMLGTFAVTNYAPIMIGLVFVPFVVKKFGLRLTNVASLTLCTLFAVLFLFAGIVGNIPLMLITSTFGYFFLSPQTGMINALIAETAEYTYHKTGKRIDGAIFSCASFGGKVGTALAAALSGILLSLGGYVPNAPVQSRSCIMMINFLYLGMPIINRGGMLICNYFLKVEQANKDWNKSHGITN